MKVGKWVDFGQEVEVEISSEDVRTALAEAFARTQPEPLDDEQPDIRHVKILLNDIAKVLNALTDEQVQALEMPTREMCARFLRKQAARFEAGGLFMSKSAIPAPGGQHVS